MPGERLMIVRTSDVGDKRFYTGDTLDVMNVNVDGESPIAILSDGMRVPILFAISDVKVDLTKPGGQEFQERSTQLKEQALAAIDDGVQASEAWKPYRDYRNSFVFVAYSYATTVHKSQGATVDRIYVSPRTLINIPKVGENLTYVALTRAKKEVHVA